MLGFSFCACSIAACATMSALPWFVLAANGVTSIGGFITLFSTLSGSFSTIALIGAASAMKSFSAMALRMRLYSRIPVITIVTIAPISADMATTIACILSILESIVSNMITPLACLQRHVVDGLWCAHQANEEPTPAY